MLDLLREVLRFLVTTLPWVLFLGWILSMADPSGRWPVTRALNTISAPYLNLVSGLLPRVGALDISPMLIVLLSYIVNWMLYQLF